MKKNFLLFILASILISAVISCGSGSKPEHIKNSIPVSSPAVKLNIPVPTANIPVVEEIPENNDIDETTYKSEPENAGYEIPDTIETTGSYPESEPTEKTPVEETVEETTSEETVEETTPKETVPEETRSPKATEKPQTQSPSEEPQTKKTTEKSSPSTTNSPNTNGRKMYATPTGKRYHYDPDCGGKNSREILSPGSLTPCKKCAQ